jgi:hypothetical protein
LVIDTAVASVLVPHLPFEFEVFGVLGFLTNLGCRFF